MAILEAFGPLCLIIGGICLVAILLAYPFAHWIGRWVANFLTFLPSEKFLRPPPALGIPRTLALRGDLEGALEGYEKLLTAHPQHLEIYIRLLEIALGPLAMESYGEDILQRGLANVTEPSSRAALIRLAHELRCGEFKPFKHLETHPPQPAPKLPNLCRKIPR
jgi:hypothetical protein